MPRKNQRKEIIEQIKDLSTERKNVSVANLTTHGFSLTSGDSLHVPPEHDPEDLLVTWEVSYYNSPNIPETVSLDLFTKLALWGNPNVYSTIHSHTNGISDPALVLGKVIRYKTKVIANHSGNETFKVRGSCKVCVYVNGRSIIFHDHNVEETSIEFHFTQGREYVFNVVVVCNEAPARSNVITVNSLFFAFCNFAGLDEIPAPENVYASENLIEEIEVSWEPNIVDQQGGGVEIWSAAYPNFPSPLENDFNFLGRVTYPGSSFSHVSSERQNVINDNHNFNYINEDPNTEEPYQNLTILNVFGNPEQVTIEVPGIRSIFCFASFGGAPITGDTFFEAFVGASPLPEFTNSININGEFSFSENVSTYYSSHGTFDITNFNYGGGVRFNFNTGASEASVRNELSDLADAKFLERPAPAGVNLHIGWSVGGEFANSALFPNATFRVRIYRAASTYREVSNIGIYQEGRIITLNSTERTVLSNNPHLFSVEIRVFRNWVSGEAYTGDGHILVKNVSLLCNYTTDPNHSFAGQVRTEFIPVSPDQRLGLDCVVSGSDLDYCGFTVACYNSSYSFLENIFIPNTYLNHITGPFIERLVGTQHPESVIPEDCAFVQVIFQFDGMCQNRNPNVSISNLSVISSSNMPLAQDTRFAYKLRNYTETFRYSDFGPVIVGKTGRLAPQFDFAFFDIGSPDSQRDVISPYRGLSVNLKKINTDEDLVNMDVWADMSNGNIKVPLEEVSSSGNDFTYLLKPVLNNWIVVDNFSSSLLFMPSVLVHGGLSKTSSPGFINNLYQSGSGASQQLYDNSNESPWSLGSPAEFHNIFNMLNNSYGHFRVTSERIARFYEGIYNELPNQSNHYLFRSQEGRRRLSIGFIFRGVLTSGVSELTLARVYQGIGSYKELARVRLRRSTGQAFWHVEAVVDMHAIPTNSANTFDSTPSSHSSPTDLNRDSTFRHTIQETGGSMPEWNYCHLSVDLEALDDSERTYIRVYSFSPIIHIVPNSVSNTLASSSYPTGFTVREPWHFKWNVLNGRLISYGPQQGNATTSLFRMNFFYMTCDIVTRSAMDKLTEWAVFHRSPNFLLFGYASHEDLTINATAELTSGDRYLKGQGVLGRSVIETSTTIKTDQESPDGSITIMRDNYTYTQRDLDDPISELVTYTKSVRILPNFLDTQSSQIKSIRFLSTFDTPLMSVFWHPQWSKWYSFTNRVFYPAELMELASSGEQNNGYGDRAVVAQVITESGNTSNFLINDHSDTIRYNPIGSIGHINSYNYQSGIDGWNIDLNGDAEFNDVRMRRNAMLGGRFLPENKISEYSGQLGFFPRQTSEYDVVFTDLYNRTTFLQHTPFSFFNFWEGQAELWGIIPPKERLEISYHTQPPIPDIYDEDFCFVIGNSKNLLPEIRFVVAKYNIVSGGLLSSYEIPNFVSYGKQRPMAFACASRNFVYVGHGGTVYKLTKNLTLLSQFNLPGGTPKTITGIKCFTSRMPEPGTTEDNIRICVGCQYNDPGTGGSEGNNRFYILKDPGSSNETLSTFSMLIVYDDVLVPFDAVGVLDLDFPTPPPEDNLLLTGPLPWHSFDCNSNHFVAIDRQGSVLKVDISDIGEFSEYSVSVSDLLCNNKQEYSFGGEWNYMFSKFKSALDLKVSFGLQSTDKKMHYSVNQFKRPQSIKIVGERAIVWSPPTSHLNNIFLSLPVSLEGSLYCCVACISLGIRASGYSRWIDVDTHDDYTPGGALLLRNIQGCYFFPTNNRIRNSGSTDILSVLGIPSRIDCGTFTADNTSYTTCLSTTEQLINSPPFPRFPSLSPIPIYTSSEESPSIMDSLYTERIIGFGIPTIIGHSMVIPYINAHIGKIYPSGTSIYKFDLLSNKINFSGIVGTTEKDQIFSLEYDGKYLWELGVDIYSRDPEEYNPIHPSSGWWHKDRQISVSRRMI